MTISTVHMRVGGKRGALAALLAVALASVTPAALAQGTPSQSPSPSRQNGSAAQAKLSDQDEGFMHKAAMGGMMQVELGKVAGEKAQNPKVKQFALQSVENFSKAGGMLKTIADGMGAQMPQQPPDQVRTLKQALAADSGNLVDQEYMAQIVPASTVAVHLFRDEAQNGTNPKLKKFAQTMLPKLEKHQQMAVQLSQNMGAKQSQREGSPPTSSGSSLVPQGGQPQGGQQGGTQQR